MNKEHKLVPDVDFKAAVYKSGQIQTKTKESKTAEKNGLWWIQRFFAFSSIKDYITLFVTILF